MVSIPSSLSNFKSAPFADYLTTEGAKVLTPTNPYEVIRYQTMETVQRGETQVTKQLTHIVYRKSSGQLTYTGWSNKHYKDFMRGWNLGAPAPNEPRKIGKPRRGSRPKKRLLKRDGDACWFCGQPVSKDNWSVEHLLSLSHGGNDSQANTCLAHESCNRMADNKSLVEKMALRDELRRLSDAGEYEP